MRKLGIAPLVGIIVLALATNAAAFTAPAPISPPEGTTVDLHPDLIGGYELLQEGVTMSLSTASVKAPGIIFATYVAASQDPTLNPDGSFRDPLALTLGTSLTHDPGVLTTEIAAPYFPGPGFPAAQFTGNPGRVYWRPYVISSDCTGAECWGPTRSFIYNIVPSLSAQPQNSGGGSTPACAQARQTLRKLKSLRNVAARRYNHARTRREARRWLRAYRHAQRAIQRQRQHGAAFC